MQFRLRFPVVDGHGDVRALKEAMLDATAPRTWIHLAYEGEWQGHPAGEFQFTREVFEQLSENFGRQRNPAPLTYEHPSYAGDGAPVPAAGWIHQLEVRDGQSGAELWAEVEFTERAAKFVRGGEYRFCSVVVDFDSTDRRTGEPIGPELYEVGLTNQPFLDGQRPIAFSRRQRAGGDDMKDPKELARGIADAGLKLKDGKTLKQLMQEAFRDLGDEDPPMEKLVEYLRAKEAVERIKSGGEASSEAPEEKPAEMSDEPEDAVALSDEAPEVALEDGMVMDTAAFASEVLALLGVESLDEALAAIQAMQGAGEAPEAAAMQTELSKALRHARKLESRVAELEDEKTRERIEQAKAERILPVDADTEVYVRLSRKAPEEFAALMAGASTQGPRPPVRRLGKAGPQTTDTSEHAAMLRRLGYKDASIQKALAHRNEEN